MVEIIHPIFVTLWEWDKMWIEWIKFYYPDQFHPKRHLISLWLSFYQIISFQQNLKSDLNSCVVFFVKSSVFKWTIFTRYQYRTSSDFLSVCSKIAHSSCEWQNYSLGNSTVKWWNQYQIGYHGDMFEFRYVWRCSKFIF